MNLSEEYEAEQFGTLGSDTFRVFFKKKLPNVVDSSSAKVYISPFHDIPLYSEEGSNIYRMVVRMPRWSNAKMEICKTEPFNPIKHDVRKNVLKYFENVFPFHGVIWNYGSFPQTWEMHSYQNPDFEGFKGDNSPVDVIEIGSKVHTIGSVVDVKVLGALLLLDQGELDWKIVAIDINDHLASKINDVYDINDYMPGLLDTTIEWFRFYKVPFGQQPLSFGYGTKFLDKTVAYETIERAHKFWKNLIKNALYFKQSKDCADFKLYNTQCLECDTDKLKNNVQAEEMIKNLKELVENRPAESMANPPPLIQIERVNFLNKKEILAKLYPKQEKKIDTGETEAEQPKSQTSGLKYFLRENFFQIIIPISVCAVIAPLLYIRIYKD